MRTSGRKTEKRKISKHKINKRHGVCRKENLDIGSEVGVKESRATGTITGKRPGP